MTSNSPIAKDQAAAPDGFVRSSYFRALTVENVRCFGPEPQTLVLHDPDGRPAGWTVLLGNNGVGKTTLLQVLALFECAKAISTRLLYMDSSMHHCPFARGGDAAPGKVEAEVLSGPMGTPAKTMKSGRVRMTLGSAFGDWDVVEGALLPPACYGYGAARRLGDGLLSWDERPGETASLFLPDTELRDAAEWLLRLDYSASKESPIRERQIARLEQVKRILIDLLPEVADLRFTQPTVSDPTPRVEFKTPYGWVPLRSLGFGYQTMIAWTVDLASRMVDRYPDSVNPLGEPAVVLVDEIDLHLHPRWQRQIVGHLTRLFPATQFIVTAHSPLIVQAAADANLAVLRREGDHVVIDNDVEAVRGWRIDQVYTSDLFELPSARPPQFDEQLKRRKELLSQPTLTEEQEREVQRLNREIGMLPAGETSEEARHMLELARQSQEMLRKYGETGT